MIRMFTMLSGSLISQSSFQACVLTVECLIIIKHISNSVTNEEGLRTQKKTKKNYRKDDGGRGNPKFEREKNISHASTKAVQQARDLTYPLE